MRKQFLALLLVVFGWSFFAQTSWSAPIVTTITPSAIRYNQNSTTPYVTIYGSGFTGATAVTFSGLTPLTSTGTNTLAPASGLFSINSDTQITANIKPPNNTYTQPVVYVTVGANTSSQTTSSAGLGVNQVQLVNQAGNFLIAPPRPARSAAARRSMSPTGTSGKTLPIPQQASTLAARPLLQRPRSQPACFRARRMRAIMLAGSQRQHGVRTRYAARHSSGKRSCERVPAKWRHQQHQVRQRRHDEQRDGSAAVHLQRPRHFVAGHNLGQRQRRHQRRDHSHRQYLLADLNHDRRQLRKHAAHGDRDESAHRRRDVSRQLRHLDHGHLSGHQQRAGSGECHREPGGGGFQCRRLHRIPGQR